MISKTIEIMRVTCAEQIEQHDIVTGRWENSSMEGGKRKTISSSLDEHDENCIVAECWSHTKVNIVHLSHMWMISNFSFLCNKVQSEVFSAGSHCDHEWILRLNPYCQIHGIDYLSLAVKPATRLQSQIKIIVNYYIINDKGEKTNGKRFERLTRFDSYKEYCQYFERNVVLNEANGLLPDNKLTILCEITVCGDIVNASGNCSTLPFEKAESTVIENFAILFDTEKFSDVVVTAGRRLFHAHKAILAAQSPVFAAMFEHDMEERKSNLVKIIDMEDEILEEMLRFMYTGKVRNIKNIADASIVGAEMYQLTMLKNMCQKSLYEGLAVENAALTLVLADLHGAGWLKKRAIDFIRMNTDEVMDTAGYEIIHHDLVTEILRSTAMKKRVKANESITTVADGEASQ